MARASNYLKNIPSISTHRALMDGEWLIFGQESPLLVQWMHSLAVAVEHLHTQLKPIRHRDINPEHIIIRNGEVVLADFDISYSALARTTSKVRTASGPRGTACYRGRL